MEIAVLKSGYRLRASSLSSTAMNTYKKTYLGFARKRLAGGQTVWGLTVFALLLAGSPCFSQSAPPESATPEASANGGDLFERVIANQKRVDADLNTYERIERVENSAAELCTDRTARGPHDWRRGIAAGAIERSVGHGVGVRVLVARDVLDGEGFEARNHFSRALVKRPEVGAFDLVDALNLANEKLGIAPNTEPLQMMRQGVIERGN